MLRAGRMRFRRAMLVQFLLLLVPGIIYLVLYLFDLPKVAEVASLIVQTWILHHFLKVDFNTGVVKTIFVYIVSTIFTGILALLMIFCIRTFVLSPFIVNGISMSPTYESGDYLFVNKFEKSYKRRDVVIYLYDEKSFIIQRVIGLPGEEVTVAKGAVRINGEILPEPYAVGKTLGDANVKLSEGQYFMLGDNRENSFDSRKKGPVSADTIVGIVFKNFRTLLKE
jgi:signal peptidase I